MLYSSCTYTYKPNAHIYADQLQTSPPLKLHTSGCVECVGVNGCVAEDTPYQIRRVNSNINGMFH